MPPPRKKSLFRLITLVLSLLLWQLLFKLQRPLFIMPVRTIICIHTYVCALLAAHIQAHLSGWHSAHWEVGRSISLKRNCQAVMGFGGQPRALLSPGRQASQRNSRLCCTPHDHAHWHACQSKEDFKEERKEESWLVLQTVIKTYFVGRLPWTMLPRLSAGQPSFNFNSGTDQVQQGNCEKTQQM